jgi:hypothetical protein
MAIPKTENEREDTLELAESSLQTLDDTDLLKLSTKPKKTGEMALTTR